MNSRDGGGGTTGSGKVSSSKGGSKSILFSSRSGPNIKGCRVFTLSRYSP